jgi:deoxyhypusine synthase
MGSAIANDAALGRPIDRVCDRHVRASEEEFCDNDVWIGDFAASLEARLPTSREFLNLLGGHLWRETNGDGISRPPTARVPIFCPAIADSSTAWACRRDVTSRRAPGGSTTSGTSSSPPTS